MKGSTSGITDAGIGVSYLRVSDPKQLHTASDVDRDGNSIATQRVVVNSKARAMQVPIVREFIEPGVSAQSIEKRRTFKELMAYIDEHPEVKYVFIYMRGRAFRNFTDAAITKRKLAEKGVRMISAKEEFGEGIMADAMEAVTDIFNEVQVRLNGVDIKTKMEHKAKMGGTNGRARIGYLNVRIEHEGHQVNTIAIDPERAPLVRHAYELYATGDYSIIRLHETMADLGLTTRPTASRPAGPLSASQLHRMLRDTYYVGFVTHNGETYPGRHEALIDQELFDRVQQALDHHSSGGQRDRVLYHYLKGLLFCYRCEQAGRTSRMIYTEAKGRGGRYAYFKCRAKQDGLCDLPHLPAEEVEWRVADRYALLGLPAEFRVVVREAMEATLAEEQASVLEANAAYTKQLAKLEKQEDRLLDLATDGTLPGDKIRARLRDIQRARAKAEAGLATASDKLAMGAEVLQRYLDLLEDPAALYARATDAARRDLNSASFSRIWLETDGVRADERTPAVEELHRAADVFKASKAPQDPHEVSGAPATSNESAVDRMASELVQETEEALLGDLLVAGSNKASLVPPTGFEPALPP